MLKSIENDLLSASDAMEHLILKLTDLSIEDKVDVGARLRAIIKNCEQLDQAIKDDIKKKLKNKLGAVLGDTFKASLVIVDLSRFNSKVFKEAHPDLYNKYCEPEQQRRVLYEPR